MWNAQGLEASTRQSGTARPALYQSARPAQPARFLQPKTPRVQHSRPRTLAAAFPPPQPRCRVRIRGTPPALTSIISHSKAAALAAAFLTPEAGDPDLDSLQNPSIVPRPELTCSNPLTSTPPSHPHDPLLPPFPFRPNTPFPGTPFPQAPHPEYTASHDAKSAQPPP